MRYELMASLVHIKVLHRKAFLKTVRSKYINIVYFLTEVTITKSLEHLSQYLKIYIAAM